MLENRDPTYSQKEIIYFYDENNPTYDTQNKHRTNQTKKKKKKISIKMYVI